MLSNYLKIAFRNLAKTKGFSLLNIGGLALGMSACLTVILIISDQYSFDKFHPDANNTYRIICEQKDGRKLATLPFPVGETLQSNYSVSNSITRLVRGLYNTDVTTATNLTLPISGFYAESSFFKTFGFKLESGNVSTILDDPGQMVITKEAAKKFFGTIDPIGQILTIKDKGSFSIAGVVATPPGKSHLRFECLLPLKAMEAIDKKYSGNMEAEKVLNNWNNRFMSYLYVMTPPGVSKKELDFALAEVSKSKSNELSQDNQFILRSQRLSQLTPESDQLANDTGDGAPILFIYGLAGLVILLILFPCINYAQLTIARSMSRSREIGIRKVTGATNSQVRNMFIAESLISALLALPLAWLMHLPLNRFIETNFPIGENGLHADFITWMVIIAFTLLVGLLAGWLPANRLAKLEPRYALKSDKSSGEFSGTSRIGWRKILIGSQFVLSTVFIILITTIWSQIEYMSTADYGFNKENLVNIPLKGNKASIFKTEFKKNKYVKEATATSLVIAGNSLQSFSLQKDKNTDPFAIDGVMADEDYLPTMGISLLAGANFPMGAISSKEKYIILNEQAVYKYKLESPQAAIGKALWLDDTTPLMITGIVKDFNYTDMRSTIGAFAIRYVPNVDMNIQLRIQPGNPMEAMASLQAIWNKLDPLHTFEGKFMDQTIQQGLKDFTRTAKMIGFIGLLAVSLACLGLLGMIAYMVGKRVKEVGVRKILGATVLDITVLLSRQLLILISISILIGLPLGYLLAKKFLSLFSYQTSIGPLILGGSPALVLLIALSTIFIHAIKAGFSNPMQALRSD
ncbi:MAG: ABC transporter permease [Saprospiraceae bacterium]